MGKRGGKTKMNIEKLLDKVETFIFINFIERKMNLSKNGYSCLTLSGKFLYFILDYPLLFLKW